MITQSLFRIYCAYVWISILVYIGAPLYGAQRTWDGGGADSDWRTAFNWDGSITRPNDIDQGDTLVFPSGPTKLFNTNDFGPNTNYTALIYSGSGYNSYGNSIGLSNGVSVTHPSGTTTIWLPILLRDDQTFSVSSSSVTLILGDDVNIGIRTLTFDGPGNFLTIGEIIDSRFFGARNSVVKNGSGRLTIFQPTDHQVPTIVNGGILSVDNRMTNSPVIVNAGGTLRGSHRLGPLTANSGGVVAPGGNAPNTLECYGDANLAAGSIFRVRLNGTSPGITHDQLKVLGTLTLGGTLELVFGYTPAVGDRFTIIDNDGSDDVTGIFAGMPEGHVFTANGRPFQISYGGRFGPFGRENDVTIEAIPALAIWDRGGGVNNLWSQPLNWQGDVIPFPGDDVQFISPNFSTMETTNDFPAGRLYGSMILGGYALKFVGNPFALDGRVEVTGPGDYNIYPAVTLRGGVLNAAFNGDVHFRGPVSLSGNQTFLLETATGIVQTYDALALNGYRLRVDAASSPAFGGPVAGPGELVKAGPGSLALSSAISCQTIVEKGTLVIGFEASGSGPITVEDGGVLSLAGGEFSSDYFQVSNLDVRSGGTFFPSGSPGLNGQTYLRSGSILSILIYMYEYDDGLFVTAHHRCHVPNNADIDITGCDLQLTIDPNASRGESFVIIDRYYNDGRVTGTFAGLPEGAVFIRDGRAFTITYRGGEDNDDVIISPVSQFVWDAGGQNNNWTTAANWTVDLAPPAYSQLVFTDNTSKRSVFNDFAPGTAFSALTFSAPLYNVAGNALRVGDFIACGFDGEATIAAGLSTSADTIFDISPLATLTLQGQFSGQGIKRGTGALRLAGTESIYLSGLKVEAGALELAKTIANGINGSLTVSTGSVRLLEDDQLNDAADVTILANGRFELNGQAETMDTLNGDGVVELSERFARFGRLSLKQGTFSGRFTGSGILTKTGSALLTLNGTSSFTGTTVLQQGELRMDGIHSNSPIRLDGGTLTGRGYVGPINGNLGGTVWPGLGGPQYLSALHTRGINFNATTTFRPVLTSSSPDFEGHKLQVAGTVNLGGSTLVIDVYNNFRPTNTASWIIIDNDGTDPVTGTFAGLPEGASVVGEGWLFRISYTGGTGNDVTLTRLLAPVYAFGIKKLSNPDLPEYDGFLIRGQGMPGLRYQVQYTLSLNPVIQWQNLGGGDYIAGTDGIFQRELYYFSDAVPYRFFRAGSP